MNLSKQSFEAAKHVLVGGVNSPVRAYNAVGGDPVFITSGSGATVTSQDGQTFIDYVLSYGPLLAGHANESVISDLHNAIIKGTTFGAPTTKETALAEQVKSFFPSIDKVRFVNSGTEATMSAIRLARGVTKRDIIIKFEGCYHGHVDSLLVAAGSGGLTLGKPSSAGIPDSVASFTRVLPYNDVTALQACFKEEGDRIAALIMEPVCGNMGVIIPSPEFLGACRSLTQDNGALLIFDEVMTGFRAHKFAAQGAFNITPDLTCLGKVIGGGLPCAAYGGNESIMNHLAPIGDVYQAGTLSGNPLAVTAGLAMMELINDFNVYEKAEQQTHKLIAGLKQIITKKNAPIQINAIGTMFTIFFNESEVNSLSDVNRCDFDMFKTYFHFMKDNGILLPPSQYEANFVSSEHNDSIIDKTIAIFNDFLNKHL
ncbi:MAG: glutamate-1-semialdehyde 2,1-aminomutase [Candidatus Margulisiibacteriota bacterium]|nr:glutamate-1-semialdehyde 2,1-aminomutase [Candidatus Margulisiibacteriota bacterium]